MSNRRVRSSRQGKFGGKSKRANTRPVKDAFRNEFLYNAP